MDPGLAFITLKPIFINSIPTGYIWGINQSSWFNIYQGKGQKGDGNESVSKINTYSDNSALELTQYNYIQVLKIWVDSDLCQRNLEGI